MFTGIVQGLGKIKAITKKGGDTLLAVDVPFAMNTVALGDSIAVNGVCLTVNAKTEKSFSVFVSAETASKTNIAQLKMQEEVNVEKALTVGGLLGGHIVSGHVDTIGKIVSKVEKGGSIVIHISVEPSLSRYMIIRGSIAVDGISLTINECNGGIFTVNIIPHTAQETTLGFKKVGALVNIEFDIIGKYVEKLLQSAPVLTSDGGTLSAEFLAQHGYR